MEDFKILFYIFAAVIFFVVRMWLKAFKNTNATRRVSIPVPKNQPVVTPKLPSTSYQDILKELQASGERARQVPKTPSLEKDYSSENRSREAKSLEKINTPTYSLEGIPTLAKTPSKKPSSIELARQAKPKITTSAERQINYNRLLQNPQNIRTAFIMSEILNRRFDY